MSKPDAEFAWREPLPGTVKLYHRHLFVCTGRVDWPTRIEEGGGFMQTLAETLKSRLPEMPRRVKLTACDEPSAGPGYDLLVFPDAVRYRGVGESDLSALVEDHLLGDRVSDRIPHEPLDGFYVFVCTHGNRDRSCGVCGPPLVQAFAAALEARGLADRVVVRGASHVGGHRFAGNVLVYPGGDWYGYVTPEDVPSIVDQHLLRGEAVLDLWRGRMGLSPEEQLDQVEKWWKS
jgi:(2Fe-2S) ferredoxin